MSSKVLHYANSLQEATGVPAILTMPLVLVGFLALLTWFITRMARGKYDLDTFYKIPGRTPLPLFGNALNIAGPHDTVIQVYLVFFLDLKWIQQPSAASSIICRGYETTCQDSGL